eukprot:Rmarinus@m.9988
MLISLILLHSNTSQGLFSQNYVEGETAMDEVTVCDLHNSATNYAKTLLKDTPQFLTLQKNMLSFRHMGEYVLVSRFLATASHYAVENFLFDIEESLKFFYGEPRDWTPKTFMVEGLKDVINHVRICHDRPNAYLVGGYPRVALDDWIRRQLDRILTSVEQFASVYSSCLLLGSTVLHSRLSISLTRRVLHYQSVRPLRHVWYRYTPVYEGGVWRYLVSFRLVRSLTLCIVTTEIDLQDDTMSALEAAARRVEKSLFLGGISIPRDEPRPQVRHFAGRDVVAFLYHHPSSGFAFYPAPRSGDASGTGGDADAVSYVFLEFLVTANDMLTNQSVNQVVLRKAAAGYTFFATSLEEGTHFIYLLCGAEVSDATLPTLADDTLEQILRKCN